MEPQGIEHRLAAILAADVVRYSRLMGVHGEGTLRMLKSYREVVNGLIAEHRGRVLWSASDSVIAEFASPVEAGSIIASASWHPFERKIAHLGLKPLKGGMSWR